MFLRSRKGLFEGRYHSQQPLEGGDGKAAPDPNGYAPTVRHPDRENALQAGRQLDDTAGTQAWVGLDPNQRKNQSKEAVIRVDDLDRVIDRNTLPSLGIVIIGVSR